MKHFSQSNLDFMKANSVLLFSPLTSHFDSTKILRLFRDSGFEITKSELNPLSTLNPINFKSLLINYRTKNDDSVLTVLRSLQDQNIASSIPFHDPKRAYPICLEELDLIVKKTYQAGKELFADHPSFQDQEYRKRREEIAQISYQHVFSSEIVPRINYTDKENETWSIIYDRLKVLHEKHAYEENLKWFQELEKSGVFSRKQIPQLQDINDFLKTETGMKMIPVAGFIYQRIFLNFLAFKGLGTTQYLRHHKDPFYTPEPDLVHEIMGHASLLASKDFADFSQRIGLASLVLSDVEVIKLANLYVTSIEFGCIKQDNGDYKIYGAGALSSAAEIENIAKGGGKFKFLNAFEAANYIYSVVTFQNIYWWNRSLEEAKNQINAYVDFVTKDSVTVFDKKDQRVTVFKKIQNAEFLQ